LECAIFFGLARAQMLETAAAGFLLLSSAVLKMNRFESI
jgi:hypothetical protein